MQSAGPGAPPDHASIRERTRPPGCTKSVTGSPAVSWRTTDRHSGAAAVSEIAGFDERGMEWSLLPSHTPMARAGAFGFAGGAR